jgi:sporulation protein YlmC with PRC-barrel domain
MLRGVSDLRRLTIAATDGNLGGVVDLCFDDRSWNVRYLVVDAGSWFPDHWVLIPSISVRGRASDPSILRGALTKTQAKEHAIRDRAPGGRAAHLQVATAAIGYTIQTEDGTIGHVKDILVDDEAWAIRYLLVDTTNRWVGKRVVVAPAWLTHVSWDEAKTFFCIATAVWDGPRNGSLSEIRHP